MKYQKKYIPLKGTDISAGAESGKHTFLDLGGLWLKYDEMNGPSMNGRQKISQHDTMLNSKYYFDLLKKYKDVESSHDAIVMTSNIIRSNFQKNILHFNFPKVTDIFEAVVNDLYDGFSKQIFSNYADLLDLSIGDKLKKGESVYIITNIREKDENRVKKQEYILKKEKDNSNTSITSTFDKLIKNYTPVKQNSKKRTLLKYDEFFKEVNRYGFLPVHFSKKIVLIAGKTLWDSLKNKSFIPSTYLPDSREEQSKVETIPALEDCIAYVTPRYEVCREEILLKGTQVDTIIVCNTDLDSVPQIINDKNTNYKFNLILLSNRIEQKKQEGTLFWNWKKEELEIIEKLKII